MEKGLVTSSNLLGLLAYKLKVGTLPILGTLDFSLVFRFSLEGAAWGQRVTLKEDSIDF